MKKIKLPNTRMSNKKLADKNEIDRLKSLLKERASEYKIFGATTGDLMIDNEIRQKINILEKSLNL